MEQPGSRHSKPASRNTLSRPSASACALTRPEPGTTSACFTLAATLRPFATSAAARRSSIRELVQEPMNTRSSLMVVIGWLACRPMYFSARTIESFFTGSCSRSGSGTFWSTASTISGDVPQLTCGRMSCARSSTTVSKCASASDTRSFHTVTAASQSAPLGANGRPFTYSMVLSSTATMPTRAPASMAMLQMVMRPSTDRSAIALPANSSAWPLPPAVPILPMIASTMSLAVIPGGSVPSTRTCMFFIFLAIRHWVASTCSTSEVPMPCAKAPKAPCVEVCESPQTTVMPGRVAPCSGPTTWTMPWRTSSILNSRMPKSSQFSSRVCTCRRETSSTIACRPPARSVRVVGTLWSGVAMLASIRHGLRPVRRRPSNACGEVTSWRMWRSM